jgi:cell division septation protein DedD
MARSNSTVIQISRKGLLIWIVLVVFVAIWMFVLGVMVGRGMAPVNLEAGKLEQELAELKARMLQEKQETEGAAAAGKTDEKPQLEFYEALKNPDKQTAFKPVKPAEPVKRKPAAAEPAARAASPRPAATASPTPVPKPAAQPASKPKTDAGSKSAPVSTPGLFAVQVASVQDIKGAEKMVARLRAKGYPAYQVRSEVAGKGTWFRVRVGGFEDREKAAGMLQKLKNDKFGGMVVSTQ